MKKHFLPVFLAFAASASAQDFQKEILPVLKEKCLKCHSAPHEENGRMKKPKGKLRLDSVEGIMAGGEDEKALVPGKPDESYMYKLSTLPRDDEDAMPPEDKGDPLTPEELATMKKWIEDGANFGDWKAEPVPGGAPAADAPKTDAPQAANNREALESVYDRLAQGLAPAPEAAVKAVTDVGGRVQPLAQDNPLLRVDCLMKRKEIDDAKVQPVAGLAANLTELDLGETQITSAGLSPVKDLKILTRLDLHKTKVGDDGLKNLGNLSELRYLNLYGTEVTDAGLPALATLKNLKSVFLWQTKVTEAGVKKLGEALPNAEINWQ